MKEKQMGEDFRALLLTSQISSWQIQDNDDDHKKK